MTSETGQSMEDIAAQEERQRLREESEVAITALNDKNIESLKSGNRRVGYRIGEGDSNSFVMAQPVVAEVDGSRYHHYIMVSTEGIRAIRFNKGRVETDGNLTTIYPAGLSLDSNYQDSERALIIAMEDHAKSWDDENGERKATAVFNPGTSFQSTLPGAEGAYYPHAENGGIHVKPNGSEYFRIRDHIWDDQHTGISGLIGDVSEEMFSDAVKKSIEAAKTAREVPVTPVSQQRKTLQNLGTLLAA